MLSRTRAHNLISGPLSNAALAILWGFFVYRFLNSYLETGDILALAIVANETIRAFYFITRQRAVETSLVAGDWIIALAATFASFLFMPAAASLYWASGRILFVIGLLGEFASIFSLGRSFALVPARRSVKTRGAYAYLRHPMYASHLVLYLGFITWSFSFWNVLVYVAFIALTLRRIANEERLLEQNEAYRAYQKEVPWKLVPGIY